MDQRLTALETRFDSILPTLATKADVEALRADIHKWMVASLIGLFIGFGGLAVAMGQILKPATAIQPAGNSQPPLVIYLPTPAK